MKAVDFGEEKDWKGKRVRIKKPNRHAGCIGKVMGFQTLMIGKAPLISLDQPHQGENLFYVVDPKELEIIKQE